MAWPKPSSRSSRCRAAFPVVALLAERRDELAELRAVIRASPALQARERAKHAGFEAAIGQGLGARGVGSRQARLLAGVGVACYDDAIDRWLADEDPHRPGVSRRLRESFWELRRLLRE